MSAVEHGANSASRKILALHQKEIDEKTNHHEKVHGVDPLHTSHKEVQVKKAPVAHGHAGQGKPAAAPAGDAAKAPAAAAAADKKPAEKKK
ncbi:hypothetical protein TVAG_205620 [Trichomonas vaginalis G3]|uniref:Uncharacterized protein n=1 Tax=Trichomonas vaginalis (strain ATCC PRA-98 / G3) TaxID=412133 RepID=A2FJF1_TRIV3|nr:hypothetical protein TVAGG3_0873330 [Trichomonas vaginalis G3]EAX94964.1 hypothetical protein TVAG_205620 [Trichomonas vaginalis G3]KAI5501516.1 hypothetical protein TVAGG3_0873330 [Trichomonas vaginalis G3]|eukprot:XP_001307894.1 hypothetical protein [Trichomonas vaginalis G3]